MTLADLVAEQHDLLVERFVEEARRQSTSAGIPRVELIDSMAYFLDDLVAALAGDKEISPEQSAAASHGVERLAIGFRVDRVVREYILIAQMILGIADEHDVTATPAEMATLLSAVGDGAAIAASEYVRRREADLLQREGEHAAFLAHEVRNSLASARFAFGLLKRRELPAEDQPLVAIVEAGLRQAGQRIDDALTGARVRGGAVTAVKIFPVLMLEEISAELAPQAKARAITINVEGSHDLTALADVRLMRSAVENLAGNAVKFSHDGGTVTLRASAHLAKLEIEVADACGGLDESLMDRLFRPFVQAGQERSGFGLGLAIARECAEAQGGALTLTNVPGTGCVFTLTIPLKP